VLEPRTRSRSPGSGSRGALPHALSLARFPLAALYVLSLDDAPIVPFSLALVACATDFLDGRLARAIGSASPRGAALDVAADACFVLAALAGLAAVGRISFASPLAAAIALADLARRWNRRPLGPGGSRATADRVGHTAGILNFALVLVASAGPLLPAAPLWLPAASIAIAVVNLVPLAMRALSEG
jgi:phosphatidylglycerophosphate synthase